jgi:uncharacterized protein GlcG (DUF336 family)
MSEVFEKQSIGSELAHRVIAAAEAKATEMGVPMGIAICDEAGVLKAFSRMDPPLAAGAVGGIDRLVVFGGGFPITVGDTIVGAVGVSGGHYSQDMDVARAGLAAVGSG